MWIASTAFDLTEVAGIDVRPSRQRLLTHVQEPTLLPDRATDCDDYRRLLLQQEQRPAVYERLRAGIGHFIGRLQRKFGSIQSLGLRRFL